MIPRATYRIQFNHTFTFADALGIVPYLAELGISHVYASPITTAAPGSMHGYDVVDPIRVNPELGGEEGLRALVAALRERGMGLIIDIVPNHMGVAGDTNAWWMDVLEHGRGSRWANVFNIDWDSGPLVLPVLGEPLDAEIAAGNLRVIEAGGRKALRLYDQTTYPLRAEDQGLAVSDHDPATEMGRTASAELAGRQNYRLTWWRAANDLLNWRRFFAINELAAVSAEDPEVFALTHKLVLDLFRDRLIDGVRVDHIDGLTDPAAYCQRLRQSLEQVSSEHPAYIVLEKILAPGEHVVAEWPVAGTSGYDFMREAAGLLHAPEGIEPLTDLWRAVHGRPAHFAAEALKARQDVLSWQFEAHLQTCIRAFAALADSVGLTITTGMMRRALERLLWVFPVYRTYGTGTSAPPEDEPVRAKARADAVAMAAPGEAFVIDHVLGWLAGSGPGDADLAAFAVARFQQLSAPIAAKGIEDTAFYRYGALLSLNDVGFDPLEPTLTIAEFHQAMAHRAEHQPHALLATATHDHKRGEDARARLAVLSAMPELWREAVERWQAMTAADAEGVDPADRYILLQALVGAWEDGSVDLIERMQAFQVKALREAALRSSWNDPQEEYEQRCQALAAKMLTPGSAFAQDFARFIARIAPAAQANTLAQTALRYTLPGVPDLYQGTELTDHSMVDPDNRRPVDYARRAALLREGGDGADAAKLRLIADLLALRRDHAELFRDGDYRPLEVTGSRAKHVLAFTRSFEGKTLTCAVAVRLGAVLVEEDGATPTVDWWSNTMIASAGEPLSAAAIFERTAVHHRIN